MVTRSRLFWMAVGVLALAVLPFGVNSALLSGTSRIAAFFRTVNAHEQSVLVSDTVGTSVSTGVSVVDSTPAVSEETSREEALTDAVRNYIEQNTEVSNFTLDIEGIEGEFARLRVVPSAGETDPAWVFARFEGSGWTVVDLGTFFDEASYQANNIPTALWLK